MARTGENIYKRKDGRWEARYIYLYDAEGKAKYRSVYGISRQEAKKKRLIIIHESMMGVESNTSPIIIFRDLAMNWLNSTKLRVKESTYARYRNQVQKHILPHLGKYQASKISTELIEQLVGSLLKSGKGEDFGLSPKTVEDILIIIKSILKFGKCHAHLELYRIKIKKEYKKPHTLSKMAQTRLHRFLANDTDYIKAGILLSLHTGIRIGELCALLWDNIDLEEQTVHIKKTIQRIQIASDERSVNKTKVVVTSPKSKNSIRTIPIPNFLTAILRKLKNTTSNFLLTGSTKYMEPRALHNHFKKCLNQSGVTNLNFHSLRHTFATNYVEAGFDVKSLSEILGHSSVKITLEQYVHSSDRLKRTNMEKLIGILLYSPSEMPSLQYAKA
jgi:integrase